MTINRGLFSLLTSVAIIIALYGCRDAATERTDASGNRAATTRSDTQGSSNALAPDHVDEEILWALLKESTNGFKTLVKDIVFDRNLQVGEAKTISEFFLSFVGVLGVVRPNAPGDRMITRLLDSSRSERYRTMDRYRIELERAKKILIKNNDEKYDEINFQFIIKFFALVDLFFEPCHRYKLFGEFMVQKLKELNDMMEADSDVAFPETEPRVHLYELVQILHHCRGWH